MLVATSIDEGDMRLTKLLGNITETKRESTPELTKKKGQRITKN